MSSRRAVGVVVVGCGGVARQYHLRELGRMRGVEIVALADPDPGALELASASARAAATTQDPNEAIARGDADAVVICAPNAAHAELACAAARAGRHVYIEKPVAVDVAGAAEVVDAIEAAGVVAAVGFSYRFDRTYARARALLAGGTVGPLRSVTTSMREPAGAGAPAWKRSRSTGGGALLDLGIHHIDLLAWLTGSEVARVDDAGLRSSATAEHDEVRFTGETSDGARLHAGFGYGERQATWDFVGDRGRVLIDRTTGRCDLVDADAPDRAPTARERLRARARTVPVIGREPAFRRSLHAWIDAIGGARSDALAGVRDGLRAQRAVELIEAAARAREAV